MLSMTPLQQIRTALGLSQRAIGELLGMTQGNVWHYEQGQTVPPEVATKLIEVANARGLAISYDHVYGGADLPEVMAGTPPEAAA